MPKASTVLGATAAAFAAVIGAYVLLSSKKSSSDDDLLPALTPDETEEILGKILEKLKVIALRLHRAMENVRQQFMQQGQRVDEAQLKQHYILPQFMKDFGEMQQSVLGDFEVDESELEEAVQYYSKEGNESIRNLSKQVKLIYVEFGGTMEEEAASGEEKSGEESETPSLETCLTLLDKLAEKMAEVTGGYIESFKEQYGTPTTQTGFEQFQVGLMKLSEEAEKSVLAPYEISQMTFQQALMKYQGEQEVTEKVIRMQMQNQQLMQQHGLIPGM